MPFEAGPSTLPSAGRIPGLNLSLIDLTPYFHSSSSPSHGAWSTNWWPTPQTCPINSSAAFKTGPGLAHAAEEASQLALDATDEVQVQEAERGHSGERNDHSIN